MKLPFVDFTLYSKILQSPSIHKKDDITTQEQNSVLQTTSRSSVITSNFAGRTIAVHDGRLSQRLYIKSEMVGFKLGCFVFTKKLGPSIHNSERNRKKKEKMRRKITQKKARKPKATAPKVTKK